MTFGQKKLVLLVHDSILGQGWDRTSAIIMTVLVIMDLKQSFDMD
jgi:hypothetical protein